MTTGNLSSALAQNRTEELALDVWRDFVAPRFLGGLDLLGATKPHIIVGGRGCGKTMLLRFFSFQSQFSKHRSSLPSDAFTRIGLYWRIDTQFAKVMSSRGIDEDQWIIAFEHFIAVYVGLQILTSLQYIREGQASPKLSAEIEGISFDALGGFKQGLKGDVSSLLRSLELELKTFEMWVSNVKKVPEPLFLPKSFLSTLIEQIASQCGILRQTKFHVFVDEFENLLEYQQRAINTRIKHSEPPLIFNIAMKRRGFATRQTLNHESISDPADFRTIDLENELVRSDFELFAAEVLLLNLQKAGCEGLPIRSEQLRQTELLEGRNTTLYRSSVMAFVGSILPSMSELEMAAQVFGDSALAALLRKKTEKALLNRYGSTKFIEQLINKDYPRESIVCSALVHRKQLSVQDILEQLEKHRSGVKSSFPDWIENNFIGCLLQLYEPYEKTCPFYGGFESFAKMARGNMRHLLELCYKSLGMLEGSARTDSKLPIIPVSMQARAAKHASATVLQEVRSFGSSGSRLHSFVLRLGSLFALSHGRNSQSEPEITHFSISGDSELPDDDALFIAEAVKWTVLFEVPETKVKNPDEGHTVGFEYVLNPIYAPYFNISYRKKRRLELSRRDFHVFALGGYEEYSHLIKSYSKKWKIDLDDTSPTLFSHLSD